MIASALRYIRYFAVTLFSRPEKKLVWQNFHSWFFTREWRKARYSREEKTSALHAAAEWLLANQKYGKDKGFSTFYIVEGHTGSYPETSGYIIDSLFHYAERFHKEEIIPGLLECADWLLSIQKESGGWQSGYVHQQKPEVVFNTGQVIRGLMHAYKISGNHKYLESCIRAADWLCDVQESDGSWRRFAFMEVPRVYDSYVAAPLLQVWKETKNERYRQAAEKNLAWILDHKLKPNGWLQDCDNTKRHNDRPILHTIAYTIDGILECASLLEQKEYAARIRLTTDRLRDLFLDKGYLWGRYDDRWNPSEHFICTGGAQMSIVWQKLHNLYKDERYREAALKMNDLLVCIQSKTLDGRREIRGALQGSFPLWGRYEPFAFPNWATKYLLDALMMEIE